VTLLLVFANMCSYSVLVTVHACFKSIGCYDRIAICPERLVQLSVIAHFSSCCIEPVLGIPKLGIMSLNKGFMVTTNLMLEEHIDQRRCHLHGTIDNSCCGCADFSSFCYVRGILARS
jgi:hypothetical protein